MFLIILVVGLIILFVCTEKIEAYRTFVQAVWPLFVAELIPAFLGTPLKESIKKIRGKECGEK